MRRLTPARQSLEEKWSQRLADAKRGLDSARANVVKIRRDYPPEKGPDGNFALSQAIRTENIALSEYNRVLRIYTELVMDGKVPDGDGKGKGEL